jgi:ATP-dependent RNA helicase DDX56/DBP9
MSIVDPSVTFLSLAESTGLDVRLRKAVSRLGHVRPTLVQAKCLPLAISSGRDLLVRARTGSGKTLAYCLPLLQKLLQRSSSKRKVGVGAVVLVPTRELCTQVHNTLQTLCYYCDDVISVAVLSVGSGKKGKDREEADRQEAMLRDKPDVLVATPAGLLAHIRSGALDLKSSVETLVVDEADLVLSFGYSNDIAEIVKSIPKICQGFLMSATLSPELDSLKKIVLHSPVVLKLEQEEAERAKGQLKQFYVSLPKRDKNLVLYVFLKLGLLKGKGLFFVNSTDAGYRLKLFLEQFHIRAAVLNAELPFRSRLNIIDQFNLGSFDYLIATDASTDAGNTPSPDADDDDDDDEKAPKTTKRKVDADYGVSRGLDFRHVSFVVNVDFPPNARSYAHRVGRTARAGAKGVALSLVETDSKAQNDALWSVQEDQPSVPLVGASAENLKAASTNPNAEDISAIQEQPQPTPLDFNLQEIEGFRYRVEDVSRAVTKMAVRETRADELRAEILNSERLQSHFEDNPADLQLLRHDRVATHLAKVQDHLKHVPKYLLPRGMQVANLNRKRKKNRNNPKKGTNGERRTDNDPLRSFDGEVTLDGVKEGEEDPFAEFMDDGEGDGDGEDGAKKQKTEGEKRVFTNTTDGTGKSTSGRNVWKEKHKKGKFSGKKRLSERKRSAPLGF